MNKYSLLLASGAFVLQVENLLQMRLVGSVPTTRNQFFNSFFEKAKVPVRNSKFYTGTFDVSCYIARSNLERF